MKLKLIIALFATAMSVAAQPIVKPDMVSVTMPRSQYNLLIAQQRQQSALLYKRKLMQAAQRCDDTNALAKATAMLQAATPKTNAPVVPHSSLSPRSSNGFGPPHPKVLSEDEPHGQFVILTAEDMKVLDRLHGR